MKLINTVQEIKNMEPDNNGNDNNNGDNNNLFVNSREVNYVIEPTEEDEEQYRVIAENEEERYEESEQYQDYPQIEKVKLEVKGCHALEELNRVNDSLEIMENFSGSNDNQQDLLDNRREELNEKKVELENLIEEARR